MRSEELATYFTINEVMDRRFKDFLEITGIKYIRHFKLLMICKYLQDNRSSCRLAEIAALHGMGNRTGFNFVKTKIQMSYLVKNKFVSFVSTEKGAKKNYGKDVYYLTERGIGVIDTFSRMHSEIEKEVIYKIKEINRTFEE